MTFISKLADESPGTMAGPKSPPVCQPCRESRTRLPLASPSTRWHSKQCSTSAGRMWVSKKFDASDARSIGSSATDVVERHSDNIRHTKAAGEQANFMFRGKREGGERGARRVPYSSRQGDRPATFRIVSIVRRRTGYPSVAGGMPV